MPARACIDHRIGALAGQERAVGVGVGRAQVVADGVNGALWGTWVPAGLSK